MQMSCIAARKRRTFFVILLREDGGMIARVRSIGDGGMDMDDE